VATDDDTATTGGTIPWSPYSEVDALAGRRSKGRTAVVNSTGVEKNPSSELAIHGQEKVAATLALCRMNLAVHGLEGDTKEANTYYEDLHRSTAKFDFVLANPLIKRSSRSARAITSAEAHGLVACRRVN
jgi:hypothetical protein